MRLKDKSRLFNRNSYLRPPFYYFGGKSYVSGIVWLALGDVKVYFEPFFGSGAVLLQRPDYNPLRHVEVIGDNDGFVINFWRAVKYNPDEVIKYLDWMINDIDFRARILELVKNKESLVKKLIQDSDYYDAKLAGLWCWCINNSICLNTLLSKDYKLVKDRIFNMEKRFIIGIGGGALACVSRLQIKEWLNCLSKRLSKVICLCGDWKKVIDLIDFSFKKYNDIFGLFLDPPYGYTERDVVYVNDSFDVAKQVNEVCQELGKNNRLRIVLAGYSEHLNLVDLGWHVYRWKGAIGFRTFKKKSNNINQNRFEERLYLSPACNKHFVSVLQKHKNIEVEEVKV